MTKDNPTFLINRICAALELTPVQLAKKLGVSYKDEIEPMLAAQYTLAEIDRDDTWWELNTYVNQKLGMLLAVKADLDKMLQRDRAKRAARFLKWSRSYGRVNKKPD